MAGRKSARGKKARNRDIFSRGLLQFSRNPPLTKSDRAFLYQSKAPVDTGSDSGVNPGSPPATTRLPSINTSSHLELSDYETNDKDLCYSADEYSSRRSRTSANKTQGNPHSYGRRQHDILHAKQTSQASFDDDGGEELIFSGRGSQQNTITQQSVLSLKSSGLPFRDKALGGPCVSHTSFHRHKAALAAGRDDDYVHFDKTARNLISDRIESYECLHRESSKRSIVANRQPTGLCGAEVEMYAREPLIAALPKNATTALRPMSVQVESDFSDDTIPLDVVDGDDFESTLEVDETSFDMDGMSDDAFLNEMTKYVHNDPLQLDNVVGIQSLLPNASPLDFEPSDEELHAQMRASWQKDRQKKALRKQARAELHRKGEFNRSSRVQSTKVGLDEIVSEIDAFIASDQSMLELQPIPKSQRKIVHEIAHAYDLTSKSTGHGLSRHPCLYKRLRSRAPDGFDANQFSRRMKHLKGNRWLNPSTSTSASGSMLKHHKIPRGGAAQYLEGEIVGATAPELNANNRGHAMLEKMGWNAGSPLGRDENQGRLDPIWHVVKSSRAGLG